MASWFIEFVRRLLCWLYPLHARLPGGIGKKWQLLVTIAFQAIPAIDPFSDPLLHNYVLPEHVRNLDAADKRSAVLITGGTGLVGLHLIDLLLRTTKCKLYVLVRAKSTSKLRKEAARYKLDLPNFEERVTLLVGDCKVADLGFAPDVWAELAREVSNVFHLAANSSFIATYEVLRAEWMPSFVGLLEFCAAHGAALHMVGSVGRFAVSAPANRTRRGVWTSGYMRQKAVQFELFERFRARGLRGSWTDCSYILGSLASGGVNPGFHDSIWKAAAIQRAVGVGFDGDATLVPVDTLVEAIWLNATVSDPAEMAPYMSLRLKRLLTSADIGVPTRVEPPAFRAAAVAAGMNARFVSAFVPPDIGELVPLMHKPFEAPPAVQTLFAKLDEEAIITCNFEYAKREFGQLEKLLPTRKARPREAPVVSGREGVSVGALRFCRHLNACGMGAVMLWSLTIHAAEHEGKSLLIWLGFLSNWTLVVHVVYLLAAARLTGATPPATRAATHTLWAAQSVALPASLAVIPLYWGQLLVPHYHGRSIHPVNAFVHGVNAISMLLDCFLCGRRWAFSDATYVLGYGFANMLFMLLYFMCAGCPDSAACDLDGDGHPYVYQVVDWRQPLEATLVCLLAILIPVPLISWLLASLTRRFGPPTPEPAYPYGFNHNGTVRVLDVTLRPKSVAEVRYTMMALPPRARLRAVGSAKSNTRCLETPTGSEGRGGGGDGGGVAFECAVMRLDMNRIDIAPDGKSATVGASVTLRELAHTLASSSLQLYSTVEIGNLTAGAMATCHTKNRHLPGEHGILSSYVTGVVLVDGEGHAHAISESTHTIDGAPAPLRVWGPPSEMLRHVRTSHGMLGVVCEVTVATRPLAGRAITHKVCRGAEAFAEVALQHSRSGASLFCYFSPYNDRYLLEVQTPTDAPPRTSWFWALREHFITVDYPLLFRLGDALPTPLASALYATLGRVGEAALLTLHEHTSAPPHAHIGWHDHESATKFQWTFLAFPLRKARLVLSELTNFCNEYKRKTGYVNAYFVSYVMEADAHATFSYAADGPVITIDPIAANACSRFLPFCEALVKHMQRTVGGLAGAFNQSIGVPPIDLGRAVHTHKGAADFLTKRGQMDPHGRFLNGFFEEVLHGVAHGGDAGGEALADSWEIIRST